MLSPSFIIVVIIVITIVSVIFIINMIIIFIIDMILIKRITITSFGNLAVIIITIFDAIQLTHTFYNLRFINKNV